MDQHFYLLSPDANTPSDDNSAIAYLLKHYDQTQSVSSLLKSVDSRNLPYRIEETNTVDNSGQQGVSNRDAAAIWALTSLFGVVQGKATGLDFMATSTSPYTPIVLDSTGIPQSVRPLYAGALLFAHGAVGGRETSVRTNVSSSTAIAYAVARPNKHYSIYILNLSPNRTIDAAITFRGR